VVEVLEGAVTVKQVSAFVALYAPLHISTAILPAEEPLAAPVIERVLSIV
jgi:hypothetical protein